MAIAVIVVLLIVGVRAGLLVARGGRGPARTALLTLTCTTVALGCLAGAILMIPCAVTEGDVVAQLRGAPAYCPANLVGADR